MYFIPFATRKTTARLFFAPWSAYTYYAAISRKRKRRRVIPKFVFCICQWIYRHGIRDVESLRRYLSFQKPCKQTTLDGNCRRTDRVDICLARDETYRRREDSHERIGRILRLVVRYSSRCSKSLRPYTDIKRRKGESHHLFSRQVARTSEPSDATRRWKRTGAATLIK